MPVRKNQIDEIVDAVLYHVDKETALLLFQELTNVQAFRTNSSYRKTIIRIRDVLKNRKSAHVFQP